MFVRVDAIIQLLLGPQVGSASGALSTAIDNKKLSRRTRKAVGGCGIFKCGLNIQILNIRTTLIGSVYRQR